MERGETWIPPTVKFLHVRHAPQDVGTVWAEARHADIVFLESTGTSDENRKWVTETVSKTGKAKLRIFRFMYKASLAFSLASADPFLVGIVANVLKEKKELYLIDVDNKNPGYIKIQDAKMNFDYSAKFFREGRMRASFNFFIKATNQLGEGVEERDRATLTQIESLVYGNEKFSGKSISIIQGAEHTAVYHGFSRRNPGIRSSRKFMMMNHDNAFSISYEYRKRKALGGTEQDLNLILMRDFIGRSVLEYGLLDMYPNDPERADIIDFAARQIPEAEIPEIFMALLTLEKFSENLEPEQRAVFIENRVTRFAQELLGRHWKHKGPHKRPIVEKQAHN